MSSEGEAKCSEGHEELLRLKWGIADVLQNYLVRIMNGKCLGTCRSVVEDTGDDEDDGN